jgi:hypothetical protein
MRAASGQRQPSQTIMVGQQSSHQPSFLRLEGDPNVAQPLDHPLRLKEAIFRATHGSRQTSLQRSRSLTL